MPVSGAAVGLLSQGQKLEEEEEGREGARTHFCDLLKRGGRKELEATLHKESRLGI